MDLSYSPEQQLLRESARRFLADRYSFRQRQSYAQTAAGFSDEIWRQIAELGWLALPMPHDYGGLDGGAVELSIIMEEAGRILLLEPYLANVTAAAVVTALGDARQRASIIAGVAAGDVRLALAHNEPNNRSAHNPLNCRAEPFMGGWRLNGAKCHVLGGSSADWLLVSCRSAGGADESAGIGIFMVPAGAPGVTVDSYPLMDGQRVARIRFDGVMIGRDSLLGQCEDALPAVEAAMDRATAAICADAVGAIDALVEATIDYSKLRVQFGKPIGTFQVVQHHIADLAVLREEARSSMLLATLNCNAAAPARALAVSSAKAKIGRSARHVAQVAVQLHGAMGVTEEMSIGSYLKRITVIEKLYGSTEFHLRRYGQLCRRGSVIKHGPVLAA